MVQRQNFLTVKFRILFYFLFGAVGPEQPSCHIECAHQPNYSSWNGYYIFFSLDSSRCLSLCDFWTSFFRIVVVGVTVESNAMHSLPRFIDRFWYIRVLRYGIWHIGTMHEWKLFRFWIFFFLISIFNLSPKKDNDDESERMEKIMIHNDDHCKWSYFDWPSNLSIKNVNENQNFMFTMNVWVQVHVGWFA